MSSYQLAGKAALVTGAGRGIGLGIARRLAAEGCRLVINDIDAGALARAARELAQAGSEPTAIAGDVAEEHDVGRLFDQVARSAGGLDILVNNAALVTKRRWLPEVDSDYFDDILRVNIRSMYLCARAAARLMAGRGGGAIVNLSSVGAARAFRASVPYITSKGAVEALTRALAMDLAPYNIRVNAVAPGAIATESWQGLSEPALEHRRNLAPLGREGRPEDVASAVAFLASPEAGYITGHILSVDGGLAAQLYSACAEIPHLIDPPPHPYPGGE